MIALLADRIVILLYNIKVQHQSPSARITSSDYAPVQNRIGALSRGRRDGESHCLLIAQVMLTRAWPRASEELIMPPIPIFK